MALEYTGNKGTMWLALAGNMRLACPFGRKQWLTVILLFFFNDSCFVVYRQKQKYETSEPLHRQRAQIGADLSKKRVLVAHSLCSAQEGDVTATLYLG